RFGNVLGSHGSVVPIFERQIKAGGPVTITDRNIIRYVMTIPEAASLVLQAVSIAKGGELFILDMGEPVKIQDLAEKMIRLYGTGKEEITVTGLRPGEKLFEELLLDKKTQKKTRNDKIYVEPKGDINKAIADDVKLACTSFDMDETSDVKTLLHKLITTYQIDER
ncbi:MAG: polysaccharide biosynthesis protein, partial [Bacilli bacterium]|nr:polysaccharide biosynthesis protein [Bacilli bacterium]